MLQDECKDLSRWLATRPGARRTSMSRVIEIVKEHLVAGGFDGLVNPDAEAGWPPQAYFSEELLRNAMLEPWEEVMAAKGVCPKCSDSLSRTSEGGGTRFSQCRGCGSIFVLKA